MAGDDGLLAEEGARADHQHPEDQRIGYAYDPAGNLVSIAGLAGPIAYGYDTSGRLREVTDPAGRTSAYSYDAAGRRTGLAYPNGTRVASAYDANGRLLDLTHRDTIGQVLAAYAYTLSPAGQRTRIEESTGRIKAYAYDSLERLTAEQVSDLAGVPVYENTFTYDAVGNRLTKTTTLGMNPPVTTSYTYNTADQLLTEDGISYTYDLAGRLTSKTDGAGTTTYQYDLENRLVRLTAPAATTTYAYDADGNRVEKTDAAGTIRYLVDPNRQLAQVLAEYTPAAMLLASYVYADDLISLTRGVQTVYYHTDGLGSTRLLTDLGGMVTDTYGYDAFGTVVARTGTMDNPFLFTGQEFDATSDLYYLRARYYDPRLGRFLSRDPLCGEAAKPVSLQEYLYANADPVNNADPSGFSTLTDLQTTATMVLMLGLAATAFAPLDAAVQLSLNLPCPPCRLKSNGRKVPLGTIAFREIDVPPGGVPILVEMSGRNFRFGTTPDHSMISSARASTDGGIVRPRALAVLRLTIRRTWVTSSTGRSRGV